MNTFIKVNEVLYPASITGRMRDNDWNDRASKSIKVQMHYEDALNLFVDDVLWSIVQEREKIRETIDENGNASNEVVIEQEVYDNSEYNIAGDIIDHRNGKITVKMGKPTAEEQLVEMASIAANLEYQNLLAMNDMEVI